VNVRPVRTAAELRRFIDFPYRLHARDPLWVPPLRRDVATLLSRRKNPFFEHAEAEYLLAERGGAVVGRIAAIANRLHNEFHHDKVGFFGFFETVQDQAVANALLDAAAAWLRERGFDTMRGPASFSTNDESGVLVDGFATPPVLMMPHNPRYYPTLLEAAGFTKAKDLLVYQGGDVDHYVPVPERLTRATELIRQRAGLTVRPLNLKDFAAEVERIKELYNKCWERNWGFIPMTDHEIDHLARQFKPVVVPDLAPFLEKDGKPVGFALAMPDLNVVFQQNRNGSMFPAALKLLWDLKRKKIHRLRIMLLGILPEYRGRGFDAILYHWIWTTGNKYDIWWGEAGWILEDNAAMNAGLVKMGFTVYKTYRMLDRRL
jgi:ribosomal protein S18 acetylase RimI-like enzyme